MDPRYAIVLARPQELGELAAIERAAVALFEGRVPYALSAEPTSPEVMAEAQAAGRLWVALADNRPVGFALVTLVAGAPRLEEMDVHPDHGRRGLGTALVRAVCAWAAGAGIVR